MMYEVSEDKIIGVSQHGRRIDLKGKRFGHLVAVEYVGNYQEKSGKTGAVWWCRCDCGRALNVKCKDLTALRARHCGCGRLRERRLKCQFSERVCTALMDLGYPSLVKAAEADGYFDGMSAKKLNSAKVELQGAEMARLSLYGPVFAYVCELLGLDKKEFATEESIYDGQ